MGAGHVLWIGRVSTRGSELTARLRELYSVTVVSSGKQALQQPAQPDILILDADSMHTTGERICKALRRHFGEIPIIHMHPRIQKSTASVVLNHPTPELIVSVVEKQLELATGGLLSCGPLWFDTKRRLLRCENREIQLTPKAAHLVQIFMEHPNETLPREQLIQQVWETTYMGDTRTLDVHIRWIRDALHATGYPRSLKTVRGVGYKLEIPKKSPTG